MSFLLHGLEGLREQRRRKSTRGSETEAPQGYLDFVASELKLKEQPTLLGGGMLALGGGWAEVLSKRQRSKQQFSDERILGSSDFAEGAATASGLTGAPPAKDVGFNRFKYERIRPLLERKQIQAVKSAPNYFASLMLAETNTGN